MPKASNTCLRQLLHEAGWSSSQLAAQIRLVARDSGYSMTCDRSTVARWLSGTRPRPPAPQLLLEALSRRLGRPVSAADAGLTRAPATAVARTWEMHPVRRLSLLTRAEVDPSQRLSLPAYSTAIVSALGLERMSQPPSPSTKQTGPLGRHRVREVDVEQMGSSTRLFAELLEAHGGGQGRTPLAAYLAYDVTQRLTSRTTENQGRQLMTRAAQLTFLLAVTCVDSGSDAHAQQYHVTAAQLAMWAGDHATHAIALRAMATHAHTLGHTTPDTLRLAERAAQAARRAPAAAQAYCQAQLAIAYAHRRDRRAAHKAITHAEHLLDRGRDTEGPFSSYPSAALHYQRGETLAALDDPHAAIRSFDASLQARSPHNRHARALTHSRLAVLLLAQGHLEESMTHWDSFLDDYPHLHSTRTAHALTVMRQHLRPHRRHPTADVLIARAARLT
ncbi:tol-pal system YbgF family protein [Streptomyces monticola]|uniref:Tol-pal system YbgF family protein n=1 Tax=Streptomyces monticola TaxID=2666263 RepID=A0ABW2JQS4_9ACTN